MRPVTQTLPAKATSQSKSYLPREHGATAMLLTPIAGVAMLSRIWRWSELAVLLAAFAALSAKDPAILLMRQQFIWKRRSPESSSAARWLWGWSILLIASVLVLFATWPLIFFMAMGAGIAGYACFAIAVTLKNCQRSTLFQIVSAAALTSTSLATCIAAKDTIETWCWWFWVLSTMQATAGILVVHARLDARIAVRMSAPVGRHSRAAAQMAVGALILSSAAAMILHHAWMGLALGLVAAGYAFDLLRQRNAVSLQMPLRKIGMQALLLSITYTALVIADLW